MQLHFSSVDSYSGNSHARELLLYRPCPNCNGIETKAIFKYSDFQFYSDDGSYPKRIDIETVQCRNCLCVYMNPTYTNFGFTVLFSEAGYSYTASDKQKWEEMLRWLSERAVFANANSVLDVGCYDGSFLASLPDHLKKVGIDIDLPAIQQGKEKHPQLHLLHGSFEKFFLNEPVDVITMFHVLEHLGSPHETLCELYRVSTKTALLILELPILELGIHSNDILGILTPLHQTHFSINSLYGMLRNCGWIVSEAHALEKCNAYRVIATKSAKTVPPYNASATDNRPDLFYDATTDKLGDNSRCGGQSSGPAGDICLSNKILSNWHEQRSEVEKHIANIPSDIRFVVIWGGGMHTEALYQLTSLFHPSRDRTYIIVDSDPLKAGKTWRGIPCYLPSEALPHVDWTKTAVLISSYGSMNSIKKAAGSFGIPENRIVTLYENNNYMCY